MKYINERGIVIEALQWDGTKEVADDIRLKFNIPAKWAIEIGDYVFQPNGFSRGILKSAGYFEKYFKPISDARVLVVEELKKEMLAKLAKRQADGRPDDWRNEDLLNLEKRLLKEYQELSNEIIEIAIESDVADFDAARRECADVANYAAMIHDSLNAMELETMQDNRRKDD